MSPFTNPRRDRHGDRPNFLNARSFLVALLCTSGSVYVCGCGGGSAAGTGTANPAESVGAARTQTGRVRVSVKWPARDEPGSRVIPAGTERIRVTLRSGTVIREGAIQPPSTLLEIADVPAGPNLLHASALRGPEVLASGERTIEVKSDAERGSAAPQSEAIELLPARRQEGVAFSEHTTFSQRPTRPDDPSVARWDFGDVEAYRNYDFLTDDDVDVRMQDASGRAELRFFITTGIEQGTGRRIAPGEYTFSELTDRGYMAGLTYRYKRASDNRFYRWQDNWHERFGRPRDLRVRIDYPDANTLRLKVRGYMVEDGTDRAGYVWPLSEYPALGFYLELEGTFPLASQPR